METGHVKQVATFGKLVEFCNAHGTMFNPSKAALQSTALSTLLANAQQAIEAVWQARTTFNTTVNTREDAFKDLNKLMTRIVNALAASGVSQSTVQEAYFFMRKVYPKAKSKQAKATPKEDVVVTMGKRISYRDFDTRVDIFEGLVKLVSATPEYAPNEADLQVIALQEKAKQLREHNMAVIQAQVALSNTRIQRNRMLYDATGIHGVALAVKRYIKAVFGYQSTAYRQVSGLLVMKMPSR